MLTDLHKDQLMLSHPSVTWTRTVLRDIANVLAQQNWIVKFTNKSDRAIYTRNDLTIEVNLVHVPHSDSQCDYYVTDSVITPAADWKTIALGPEVFGIYFHDFKYNNVKPTKAFNCFINRGCTFRQSWMYQFVRRNLLDDGYVSYWCQDRSKKATATEHFDNLLIGNEIFTTEHQQLQGQIPYKNFDSSIEDAILDSERTIILETFFDNTDAISFSEKTWRSLQLPRPWLLMSCVGAVEQLRQWGFDVFDDYVDHSYDSEPEDFKRQLMILDQLSAPIQYTDTVLKEFEQRAKQNQQLLSKLQALWPDRFKAVLNELEKI